MQILELEASHECTLTGCAEHCPVIDETEPRGSLTGCGVYRLSCARVGRSRVVHLSSIEDVAKLGADL